VIQQLANDIRGLDDDKRASLARIFGCDDWEERFYEARPATRDMFGEVIAGTKGRVVDGAGIAAFARERFGSIFDYVSDPLPLMVNGHKFFELYCFSSGNPKAVRLIKKGVNHVLDKFTPLSLQRSSDNSAP
jgi:hypothetical protein